MISPLSLFALDIETSTAPVAVPPAWADAFYPSDLDRLGADGNEVVVNPGLDCEYGRITSVAIAGHTGAHVLLGGNDGGEAAVIAATMRYLNFIEYGVVTTWNGGPFDLPFLHYRASKSGLHFADLTPINNLTPKYSPLIGFPHREGDTGVYGGRLGNVLFWDISFAFKRYCDENGVKHSLKDVAESLGLAPIRVDRKKMHQLTQEEEADYVASDAVITRLLALWLLGYSDWMPL